MPLPKPKRSVTLVVVFAPQRELNQAIVYYNKIYNNLFFQLNSQFISNLKVNICITDDDTIDDVHGKVRQAVPDLKNSLVNRTNF